MSKEKTIENPEVPGLEQNLPPPLPSVPKSSETSKSENSSQSNQQEVQNNPPVINSSECQANFQAMASQFYMSPTDQQQPLGQPVPWWIPTDSDSNDMYSSGWLDNQNRNFPPTISDSSGVKQIKRKLEEVNSIEDEEKVASAQSQLSALMKPLKCDLCNAIMNSTLQAKLHYDGKPHQKKVAMFLNQNVKKIKAGESCATTDTTNDWSTYCSVCKTWFTSQADASQHYAGKKHIRATTGASKQKSPKKTPGLPAPVDPTGRFGIGTGFQSKTLEIPAIVETTNVTPVYNAAATTFSAALRCDLCGVTANRLEQLETHKKGTRHQKMLRLHGLAPTDYVASNENVSSAATLDYSIYRTPSGSYYCAPCDKSFPSENSFAQHVESKKHKNQVNPKLPGNQSQNISRKEKLKSDKL